MKDRDREDDRDRGDRDRDFERENGTNGDDRKGESSINAIYANTNTLIVFRARRARTSPRRPRYR